MRTPQALSCQTVPCPKVCHSLVAFKPKKHKACIKPEALLCSCDGPDNWFYPTDQQCQYGLEATFTLSAYLKKKHTSKMYEFL